MKKGRFKIYLLIELLLYIALLVFQIVYISKGYILFNLDGELFLYIAILHVFITLGSFLFTIYIFLINKNKERMREDLFVIYFFLILIADIFFSLTKYSFMGHILFVLAYMLVMYIRKAKIYEYIGVLLIGTIGNLVFLSLGKLSILKGIDCFLAPTLIFNLIMCIINYIKNNEKANLIIMLAFTMILLGDLSIALGASISNSIICNILGLINWPSYITGCILINYYYKIKRDL